MQLGSTVTWKDCPGSIWMFTKTSIRGLSPCGDYALLSSIYHPVDIKRLEEGEELLARERNDWGEDGFDLSNGHNLNKWIAGREG